MASLKYWLWLSTRKGLGALGKVRLLDHFVMPDQVFHADPEEFDLIEDLTPAARQSLRDQDTSRADQILADCERLGLRILTWQDADYPERLRQIADPPIVLYVKGRLPAFDEEAAIGIVGAREPTPYGERMAERLGYELAQGGALVVSGIAKGLDSLAIRGALKAGKPVVSVLGGGTDMVYPYENRFLYQDVAAAGALITEYPPGTENKGHHFPIRNRIISGLCLGVTAVECRPWSGTMTTMDLALEQNRDLYAVPGPADAPMSAGPNRLIQQGAKLVTCGSDILVEYLDRFPHKLTARLPDGAVQAQRLEGPAQTEPAPAPAAREEEPSPEDSDPRELITREQQRERFTDDELAILAALGAKRRSADELVELTQIPVRRVTSALTMLQVRAAVSESAGRRFEALVRLEE